MRNKSSSTSEGPLQRRDGRPLNYQMKGGLLCCAQIIALVVLVGSLCTSTPTSATPQVGPSVSWMNRLAAFSGRLPKMSLIPRVQFDMGDKYYKTLVKSMRHNFKRSVKKANERFVSSMSNVTANEHITLIGPIASPDSNQHLQQRVSIQNLRIHGLDKAEVTNVDIKKDGKLYVMFSFKTIRISGKCVLGSAQQHPEQSPASGGGGGGGDNAGAGDGAHRPRARGNRILEAKYWNTTWSANIAQMIGREHLDTSHVYTAHTQRKLRVNLNGCPKTMHEELRAALLDRVKSHIDDRLFDIMETVIIRTETLGDEAPQRTTRTGKPDETQLTGSAESSAKRDKTNSKRALGKNKNSATKTSPRQENPLADFTRNASSSSSSSSSKIDKRRSVKVKKQRVLKRTKRQTPCEEGEELDDYVDQLFRFGTRIIRAMEPLKLPNTTIDLPDYNIQIFLYDGVGTRAYKFNRTKSAWVFCNNETISLGITIQVDEMRVAYKYRVISGTKLLFDGDLEARLSPKAQAQISQAVQPEDSEEEVQQRVDRVRLFRLGRVFVIIRGLGNLTSSLSLMINSYLNDNQEELQPTFRMFEGDAVKMINRMLETVQIPILNAV